MCGIVGYLGTKTVTPLLCRGIKHVEYRGYDSAGIGVVERGKLEVVKFAGYPQLTIDAALRRELTGSCGLAHTRWATHGKIVDKNAHPHLDCRGTIGVVHNGMLWNHEALLGELVGSGHAIRSDTDTECIAHFIEAFRSRGLTLLQSVQNTARLLKGSAFAIVVVDATSPDEIVGACQGGELYVGLADHGTFLASDHRAFAEETKRYVKVETGMVVHIRRGETGPQFTTFDNEDVVPEVEELWYDISQLTKGPYEHFMLSEMMFQETAIRNALEGRIAEDQTIRLGGVTRNPHFRQFVRDRMKRVMFVACGTSKYAGDVAARHFLSLGLDAHCVNAGEYVTSPMRVGPETLVIPVSQSGTTREVLLAAEMAKAAGAEIWPIVNVPGSTLSRFGAGHGMYVQAGLETSVASTKAFTGQIVNAAMLGYVLADIRGTLPPGAVADFCRRIRALPDIVGRILANNTEYIELGASLAPGQLFLYLGKGYGMAVAEEGALKLKEVTYVPAFGLSASDLKHGPLAMLDGQTIVIAVCLPDENHPQVYEWTVSNVKQVLSRGGKVIVVCHEGDDYVAHLSAGDNAILHAIQVPATTGIFTAVTSVIPLQFLAYGLARELAKTRPDVTIDKPRHIAKVTTVE